MSMNFLKKDNFSTASSLLPASLHEVSHKFRHKTEKKSDFPTSEESLKGIYIMTRNRG